MLGVMKFFPGKLGLPFNLVKQLCRLEENLGLGTTENILIYKRITEVVTSILVNMKFEAKLLGLETRENNGLSEKDTNIFL